MRKNSRQLLSNLSLALYHPKKDQCDTCGSYKPGHVEKEVCENHWLKKDEAKEADKKGQSRLHLLRRLMSFGVQGALLRTFFFDTTVASAIFYEACWGSSISTVDRKRLARLIKKASCVLEAP